MADPPECPAAPADERRAREVCQPGVVHLTVVHRPDDTRIYHRECRSLAAAGYKVSLVAPGADPGTGSGVTLIPIPKFDRRLSRGRRLLWGHPALLATAVRIPARLYHVHDPELLLIAAVLKGFRRARVVYDVHEDYRVRLRAREWLPRAGRSAAAWAAGVWEGTLARMADGVVAVSETIARHFPPGKTVVVKNYPLPPGAVNITPAPEDREPALLLATGGVTNFGGLLEVTRALEAVATPGIRLVVLGGHRDRLANRALAGLPAADRVNLHGQVPLAEVYRWMARATIGIVCNLPVHGYENAEPTKLYEYMAAGLPVIASHSPPWSAVVEGTGCGVTVDPTQPGEIAAAIDRLLADHPLRRAMGERGRRAAASRFTWESQAAVLRGLYQRLVGPGAV